MSDVAARLRIGTAIMLVRDLELYASGIPVFDRIVDARGSSLGSAARWRELIHEVLADEDIAEAAPEEFKGLLNRWAALAHINN